MALDLRVELFREIDRIPIYDIHTHVDPARPLARGPADVVGYHYFRQLAHSASPLEQPAAPAGSEEAARQVLERLPLFANTIQHDWLMVIGETFLGIGRKDWRRLGWDELARRAQERIDAPGYREAVLERSGIRRIYMTNQPDEDLTGYDRGLLVPCLRVDPFVSGIGSEEERRRLERAGGGAVRDLTGFDAAMQASFRRFAEHGMAYAAVSTEPGLRTRPVSDEEASTILDAAVSGRRLDETARRTWAAYALDRVAHHCRAFGKPLHLMVGARRDAYAAAVPDGGALMDSANSLAGYDYLFNRYPDVRFPVSVVADTPGLELAVSAWVRHNVYASGHWWFSNNPVDISRELQRRLDIVPGGKLLGFYSDAYYLEFILPKFRTYKFELAEVLAERVARSHAHPNMAPMSSEQALELAEDLLLNNPMRLFGDAAAG